MILDLQDFSDATALERQILEWTSPRAPISIPAGRIDFRDPSTVAIAATGGRGPHPERVAAMAQLRPLLFGVGWKVLDLIVELALAPSSKPNQKRWTIQAKSTHAQAFDGIVAGLTDDVDIWKRICLVYVSTTDARHALVHRRLQIDTQGAFVNLIGKHLTVTVDEQSAIQGLALCSSAIVLRQNRSTRDRLILAGYLNVLGSLHGSPTLPSSSEDRWTVVINSEMRSGRWTFDARSMLQRAQAHAPKSSHFDIEIHLVGSGLAAPIIGALEVAAEQGVTSFDPSVAEPWMNP